MQAMDTDSCVWISGPIVPTQRAVLLVQRERLGQDASIS